MRATVVAVLLLLTACGSTKVPIDVADLSASDAAACQGLVDDVPKVLSGELRRSVDPDDAPGAAWGDPAYVLTCGVRGPDEIPPGATCLDVGGVGWYVDADAVADPGVDITATALTHTPRVSLLVPARHRTNGFDTALVELAGPITDNLAAGTPCQ